MSLDLRPTAIAGCHEIVPRVFRDDRGVFVKTFHQGAFEAFGLETRFAEGYYSHSRRGVLRGLHFQLPPQEHCKMVYCAAGEVLDAVVDLRVGSPTYGEHATFRLNAEEANMLYIPPGLAHGFYVLSDHALMFYQVTTAYSAEHDSGILWSSAGIPWPDANPVISDRDQAFPPFREFASPFVYEGSVGI